MPTSLQKVVINPKRFLETIENNPDLLKNGVPVVYAKQYDTLHTSGIQIKGLKTNLAPRRVTVRN